MPGIKRAIQQQQASQAAIKVCAPGHAYGNLLHPERSPANRHTAASGHAHRIAKGIVTLPAGVAAVAAKSRWHDRAKYALHRQTQPSSGAGGAARRGELPL